MTTSEMLTKTRLFWGLSTGLAVAVLCAGIFTLPGGKAKANDAFKLDIHDVPEAGLTLISSADQSFDRLLKDVDLLPGLEAFRERLRPFSVFMRNGAAQTVIGYRIVWKVTNTAGFQQVGQLAAAPSCDAGWGHLCGRMDGQFHGHGRRGWCCRSRSIAEPITRRSYGGERCPGHR